MALRKKRKAGRARCIRSYVRIARENHGVCPFCHEPIEPGEEYEGSVWVNGAELWVNKEHMFCEPWDDGWLKEEDIESKIGFEEEFEEYELPMAA